MQVTLSQKIKLHILVLPRHFALPFFGGPALIGSLIAGGTLLQLNTWLGFIAVMFFMWSGHAANSFWDWKVGLDKPEEGSVAKGYTAGCRPIPDGLCSPLEVMINSTTFAVLGLAICGIIAARVSFWIFIPAILGLAVPYLYTSGKFSFYHETALASGVVLAGVTGMFAVNPHPDWWTGVIVTLPVATILSYLGLAFDEYLDAYSNLEMGVKSLAYKVWEYRFDLSLYILAWLVIIYTFQVFLITIRLLKPLTMLSLICFPFMLATLVFLKPHADAIRENPLNKVAQDGFNRVGKLLVLAAIFYPVLVVIGQMIGG